LLFDQNVPSVISHTKCSKHCAVQSRQRDIQVQSKYCTMCKHV